VSARGAQLARTVVSPSLAEPIVAGKNLIFCSTFQIAWNELAASLGGAVLLEGDPPLSRALNQGGPSAEDIDAASYVARAGEGPRFLGELRAELVRRFGERDDFMLPAQIASDTLLAYAYLSKDLAFPTPFAADQKVGLLFQETRVPCFGVWDDGSEAHRARAAQVVVHDDAAPGDFVLELSTRAEGDRLLVARVPPRETLLATVTSVMDRAARRKGLLARAMGSFKLGKLDTVRIPLVDLDLMRTFVELMGRAVIGKGRYIGDAAQRIRFRLDEKGAILRSAGLVWVPRGGPRGRAFHCDGPFLILLVRAGRPLPYFAAWVDNPEILAPLAAPV